MIKDICPNCEKVLSSLRINEHLDFCLSENVKKKTSNNNNNTSNKFLITSSNNKLEPIVGFRVYDNFLTLEEETFIVAEIDKGKNLKPSTRSGVCDVVNFGYYVDYAENKVKKEKEDLPEWMDFIIERFKKLPALSAWCPNNCNVNSYEPKIKNHFLRPHVDDRIFSGGVNFFFFFKYCTNFLLFSINNC